MFSALAVAPKAIRKNNRSGALYIPLLKIVPTELKNSLIKKGLRLVLKSFQMRLRDCRLPRIYQTKIYVIPLP
jgi:hypothetical protein